MKALVDSGADYSVISEDLRRKLKVPLFTGNAPILKTASGGLVNALGKCVLRIDLNGMIQPFEFLVFSKCSHDLILGWDFFQATEAVIDCGAGEIQIGDIVTEVEQTNSSSSRLYADALYRIPAKSMQRICALSTNRMHTGEVVLTGSPRLAMEKELYIAASIVNVESGKANIWITNGTSQPQVIPCGAFVADFTNIKDGEICAFEEASPSPTSSYSERFIDEREFDQLLNPELSTEEKRKLRGLIIEFRDVFDFRTKSTEPLTRVKHRINTGDASPIRQKPYRVSPAERKIIEDEVSQMLKLNIIEPSESPWSSPVVLVRKKDGSWRFCVDYRRLNKVTKKDVYPLPRVDDALDNLAGAKFYSSIDLKSGYWQIQVDERDREKTAFVTPDGLYHFKVMPFGLCNAPATFERMMDSVLRGLKWKICMCYLDDVIVYSSNFDEHIRRLRIVLKCLHDAGLILNRKKCAFGQKKLKILGHLVDQEGIHTDTEKIEAIQKFPTPACVTDVRSFLGICSYYRRFVPNFADLARPLHNLLKKGIKFIWDKEQENSFIQLKSKLVCGPVLGHFMPDAITHIHTDASGHGIGAVLIQIQGGNEKPIAYASRTLSSAEKNYSTTEKECLSVVWAIGKFRSYLWGRPFTVVTDHHSLCWLANLKDPSGRLARWALRLQEFDISIQFKSGKKHKDADCLSRNPISQPKDDSFEDIPSFAVLTNFKEEQAKDQTLKDLRAITSKTKSSTYSIRDGILYRKNYDPLGQEWLLVVPKHLRSNILKSLHDAPTAGHLGFAKTYDRVRRTYYWPGMFRSVRRYVSHCRECQRRKSPPQLPPGMLQPITPANIPFAKIGIDLLGRFPLTNEKNRWVIVCTDYLTRFTVTKATPTGEAIEIAKFLVEEIILKHGAPREIISDRGRAFMSNLISEINALCRTAHLLTTAYHPQTNGLTERFNKTLADMLSMYVSVEQKNWDSILPFVTFAYNSAKQETTGFSPFFLLYGRNVETPLDVIFPIDQTEASDNYVKRILTNAEEARQLAQLHILRGQAKDKNRYDARHRHVIYKPGDHVWVFTPVRKVGLSEKLLRRYFGPYRVTRRLSDVTYAVESVEQNRGRRRSQDVVHVLRLKPYLDPERQLGEKEMPTSRRPATRSQTRLQRDAASS